MSETLLLAAFKKAWSQCDCLDSNPLWWNTIECNKFVSNPDCPEVTVAISFNTTNSSSLDNCGSKKLWGDISIFVYSKPGLGVHEPNSLADCIICCLENNSSSKVEDADTEQALTLYFIRGKFLPSVRRRFFDGFGRAVTEISVPYTAQTCKCR